MLLAQVYSTRRAVKLSALFLSVRLALKRGRLSDPGQLDMRIPFLFACLLSATASPWKGVWLSGFEAALILWLLLANRPRQRVAWTLPIAIALSTLLVVGAVLGSKVQVEEDEVRRLYQDEFESQPKTGTEVHLRQILITYRSEDPNLRTQIREQVVDAQTRILSGEPFELVAQELSEVSPQRGGDVGWLHLA